MFDSSEMLRFNSDERYKTVTGGIITLTIVIVVVVGLASMIGQTVNRTAITYSEIVNKQENPSYYER
jgi:hypothetical protein